MARFGRVVTAMVTPFKTDGSLDVAEAQRLARHLIDHGSDGIVVCGSTGEGATMTDDEKVALFRAIVDAVGGDAKVIAGTGTYSTEHSIHLTREAEKAGVDGALVVTPYYNRPPQDALADHFRAVADSSNLPVMLYDVASRTATPIAVETTLRAAEHPNIVAMRTRPTISRTRRCSPRRSLTASRSTPATMTRPLRIRRSERSVS